MRRVVSAANANSTVGLGERDKGPLATGFMPTSPYVDSLTRQIRPITREVIENDVLTVPRQSADLGGDPRLLELSSAPPLRSTVHLGRHCRLLCLARFGHAPGASRRDAKACTDARIQRFSRTPPGCLKQMSVHYGRERDRQSRGKGGRIERTSRTQIEESRRDKSQKNDLTPPSPWSS